MAMKVFLISTLVLLSATACDRVQFSSNPLGSDNSQGVVAPQVPSTDSCLDWEQPTSWVSAGAAEIACPDLCSDGSSRQCQVDVQKEVRCVTNAAPVETGNTRYVGAPIPETACPIQPVDCADHKNGSSWWVTSGTVDRVCETCPDGSDHLCQKEQQTQMTCLNGVVSSTNQFQDGTFISYENQCLPLPPKACGLQASGSSWWESSGTEQSACQSCWDGSQIQCQYVHEIEKTCNDGNISDVGSSRRGSLIQTIGQCPAQPPKACGDIASGSVTWQENGQMAPTSCDLCADGSHRQCINAKEDQLRCDNGSLLPTGINRAGRFIGYATNCPFTVTAQTETFKATDSPGKADLLFIVDTTSKMDVTLRDLGKRFYGIFNSWGKIDWQLAITNSKVQSSIFDKGLDGHFMPLQKNSEVKPVSYIAPSTDPFSQPYFFRTLSRDVSDDGCNTQPYCMLEPSEPMLSMMEAIDQRNSSTNKGFFRAGAKLVTIIISANDERETGLASGKAVLPKEAVDFYNKTLGSTMTGLIGLSVIIKPGDDACSKKFHNIFELGLDGHEGVLLEQFASLTGGVSASICDSDYGSSLGKIAEKIKQQTQSITLKDIPYGDSLQIDFAPSLVVHWVLSGKKVTFDKPIPAGTQITARYGVRSN